MRRIKNFFQKGIAIPALLGALAFVGFLSALSVIGITPPDTDTASIALEPKNGVFSVDETFAVRIIVSSEIPVNVFGGELAFDQEVLRVESIDYNTSIADLWAEKPWYSNGAGTLNFIGGTTHPGGFVGSDTLMTIVFRTVTEGNGGLTLRGARILQHDGLGTEALLTEPIDALFTVESAIDVRDALVSENTPSSSFTVLIKKPNTDLNGDGKQNLTDTSIFMLHLGTGNLRSDFNNDGSVNTQDLSILLDTQ